MSRMEGRPVEILLVEDNEGDVCLTEEAFEEGRIVNRINVVRDGVEAMDFLHRRGAYSAAPRPDIILLDLNLPKKNGRQVLEEIKADRDLRLIPVVILTTSRAEEDVVKTYDLGANCYVSKPVEIGTFVDAIKKIEDFWLSVVRLPKGKV